MYKTNKDLRVHGFIFARGGSKGVPGKNIRPLAGKPLIAHAIETARKSVYLKRIIVSTDDEAIARVARESGAEVPFMRPAELAQDTSAEWLAWQHAIKQSEPFDVFVSVPATCPLRDVSDIDRCIEALLQPPEADIVLTVTQSHANPYFTMVTPDPEGYLCLAAKGDKPFARRQDAPKVMDVVGVAYATRPEFVLRTQGLWEGKVKSIEVPQERAIDIDTEFDFLVADLVARQKKPHA